MERGDSETLISLLRGTDQSARKSAALRLRDLKDPAAVGPLVQCLQASDLYLRSSALQALKAIGDHAAIPGVYELAKEEEVFWLRALAMEALCALGDPRGIELIEAALIQPDVRGRRWFNRRWFNKWAASTLDELNATSAVPALRQARRHADPISRWRLGRTIKKLERLASSFEDAKAPRR